MSKFGIVNSFVVLKSSIYGLAAGFFESVIGVSVEGRELLAATAVAAVCFAIEVSFGYFEYAWINIQKWYQKRVLQKQIKELEKFQSTLDSASDNFQEAEVEKKRLQRNMTALITGRDH